MSTFVQFQARFPEFALLPEARWEIFRDDSILEMGTDDGRWVNLYNIAQDYLIAHYITVGDMQAAGDANAVGPLRSTEVDDVIVDYAVSKTMENSFDEYLGTSYGQRYVRYRRMAFGGPRAV